jgi:hypothetical protein
MSPAAPDPFKMNAVKSSNLAGLGYDPVTRELRVKFSKGGLFSYADVPQTEYDALRQASSIGAYFSSKIRPKFKATDLRTMSADSAREFLNRSSKP